MRFCDVDEITDLGWQDCNTELPPTVTNLHAFPHDILYFESDL